MYVLEQVEFQAVRGYVLGGGGGGGGFISGSSGCSISGWLLIKILYIGGRERVIGCHPSFALIPPPSPLKCKIRSLNQAAVCHTLREGVQGDELNVLIRRGLF